jgi:peptidoglycan/LPS O-acetylase OafA/YrhL
LGLWDGIKKGVGKLLSGSFHDLPQLDGLRALAVLMVLTYHVWVLSYLDSTFKLMVLGNDLSFVFAWGHPGVDLFFMLSGFLLFLPFAGAFYSDRKRPDVKKYFVKRLCRILPAYYLFLLVSILVIYPQQYLISQAFPQVMANFFFMQTFMFSTPVYPAIGGVTWTLVIEMQFYLILPLVAYFFRGKRAWVSFIIVVALVFLYRVAMLSVWNANSSSADFNYFYASEYNVFGVFDNFAIGMLLANFYQHNKIKGATHKGQLLIDSTRKLIWIVPFVLIFSIYQYFLWRFDSNVQFAWNYFSFLFDIAIYGCFAIVIIYLVYHESRLRRLLSLRYVGIIGVVSFSVYLWHFTIIQQLSGMSFLSSVHGWDRYFILLPVVLILSLALAFAIFVLVEKRFITYSHNWAGKAKK